MWGYHFHLDAGQRESNFCKTEMIDLLRSHSVLNLVPYLPGDTRAGLRQKQNLSVTFFLKGAELVHLAANTQTQNQTWYLY